MPPMQYLFRIEFSFTVRAGEHNVAIARTFVLFVSSRFGIKAFCAPHFVVDLLELFLAVWAGEQFDGHFCDRLDET